jgi:hypothetical protein
MVWRAGCGMRYGGYIPKFEIASKILLGKIVD